MGKSLMGVLVAGLCCLAPLAGAEEATQLRVLILSGANNHDWKQTTPAIKATLEETGKFLVDVEENVPGMTAASFSPYSVILSNYNTYGKGAPKGEWGAETKKAFLDHIAKGNGLVIVHAGSSVFYDWPEFQNLACGTWGKGTSHGQIHVNRVTFTAEKSPITDGLQPFWIRDEFWHDVFVAPGAKPLASVTPDPASKGSGKAENILHSTEIGGGRGFAIFLGHDTTAMKNTAWRTLLQRGTEWAATGKVTIPPSKDWPAAKEDALRPGLSWLRTDTSLGLSGNGGVIWRLVFDPAQPKSYFHPLATVDGKVLTGFEPKDHPWHRGLWWSWKTINGINYWEENPTTRVSEGITEQTGARVELKQDYGAGAELQFSYHPPGQPAVLTEKRRLTVSPPDAAGTYMIDWISEFTAGEAPVKLDRTPPPHEGGPAHGGYAGISLRFPQDSRGFTVLNSEGKSGGHGKAARWVSVSEPSGGIAILDHPANLRHPSPWYVSETPGMLFLAPAPLFNETLELAPREMITLTYRVIIHSQPLAAGLLEERWSAFAATPAP